MQCQAWLGACWESVLSIKSPREEGLQVGVEVLALGLVFSLFNL